MNQQFQGPVYGRKTYVCMDLMHGKIDVLSTDMLGRVTQHFEDGFPGSSNPMTVAYAGSSILSITP